MLDKNGILAGLLKSMRQSAADQVCTVLRCLAAEIEAEGFAELWADR